MPKIAGSVTPQVKAAFAALAHSQGMSESALLAAAVSRLVAGQTDVQDLERTAPPGGRKRLEIRLWGEEREQLAAVAAAEGVSANAWVIALLRRTLLHVVPFSPVEVEALKAAVVALGPIGRNLNTLVREWHKTGHLRPREVEVEALMEQVRILRKEVRALADGAVRRYDAATLGALESQHGP